VNEVLRETHDLITRDTKKDKLLIRQPGGRKNTPNRGTFSRGQNKNEGIP